MWLYDMAQYRDNLATKIDQSEPETGSEEEIKYEKDSIYNISINGNKIKPPRIIQQIT